MKTFLLWDSIEKCHVNQARTFDGEFEPIEFATAGEASSYREGLFDGGTYPDHPITAIQVQLYANGKFIKAID